MAVQQPRPSAVSAAEISGAAFEVADLDRARAFYEPIFDTAGGTWEKGRRSLRCHVGDQTVELVQRARPRAISNSGYHWGYRVPRERLDSLVRDLTAGNTDRTVNWWREDDPAEQPLSAYVDDPSGNRVQLMPGDAGPFLDHIGLEQHDLEAAEIFYTRALGAQLSFHHGWDAGDYHGLEAWMAGDDPSAPWTHRVSVSYRDHTPRPLANANVFLTLGATRLGLFLTATHHQEPPPGVVRGTPRVVLRSHSSADELAEHLATVNVSPVALKHDGGHVAFEREGRSFFLRDPGGHFVEVVC